MVAFSLLPSSRLRIFVATNRAAFVSLRSATHMHKFLHSHISGRLSRMITISGVALLILYVSYSLPTPMVLSRWAPFAQAMVALAAPAQAILNFPATPQAQTTPTTGWAAFERHSRENELIESVANGQLRLYQRKLQQGSIVYAALTLGDQAFLETINADGASPGSDATGDTIWLDGKQHLQAVTTLFAAPYAQRPGAKLIGALAFGFHGDVRTSNEGTVVSDGKILRVNAGRAALCISPRGQARIGLFDATQLEQCQQAFGAGPILMLAGKIAHPDLQQETQEFLPFNPLQEDFTQIDWRRTVYAGRYPKTIIGIGQQENGHSYAVLLTSYDANGLDVMRELRAMGCTEAIGGDDDSSTQLVWRGTMTLARPVRAVPDAIGIYIKTP